MMDYTGTLMCFFFVSLLCLSEANDILSVKTNKVEFRTEAPREALSDTPKDCYEYLYGRLSELRRHGTTWTNGVSDCSNCTCDNGDIRCFFHFCNGPSTGYMTPPSTEIVGENSSTPTLVEIEDPDTYESSGFRPNDLVDDDDVMFIINPKEDDYMSNHIVRKVKTDEKSRKFKLNKSHISEMTDDEDLQDEVSLSAKWPAKILPEKWQNELSTFETSSAPSASFKSEGDLGVPRDKGKKDRSENETHDVFKSYFCGKPCKKNCPQGFKVDPVSGCWKCTCNRCPSLLSCTNKCPMGFAVDVHGCETCNCLSELSNKDIVFKEDDDVFEFRDNFIVIPGAVTPQDEDDFKWPNTIIEEDKIATIESPHVISPEPEDDDEYTTLDEPCNTTAFSALNPGDIVHESRSTSRIPIELMAPSAPDEEDFAMDESSSDTQQKNDDDATVKILAKDDQSLLLLILIPMGVVFSLGIFLSATMWRRYHRDKYDINSYRPEERQKLRPVKTLQDDHSPLKHV